jgi:cytochrome c oxidase subunit 2
MTTAPLGYLHTYGPAADPVTRLGWGLGFVSVAVVVIVSVLLLAGLLRRRGGAMAPLRVERSGHGLRWIYVGVGLSTIVLLVCTVWTVSTIAAVGRPAPDAVAARIEVTGSRWWWRVRYLDDDPSRVFITANELHVPVGRPVQVTVTSDDVIHSFWVPQLAGKTDAIPGLRNTLWLQADRAGRYRGQCGEFCGMQHAHMALEVVAEPPEAFDRWRAAQTAEAHAASGLAGQGQAVFQARCGACHTVRGGGAGGAMGPDLTHLMSRARIAAGMLPNDTAALRGWIEDAPSEKPGTLMPRMALSGPDLNAVTAYLQTLN